MLISLAPAISSPLRPSPSSPPPLFPPHPPPRLPPLPLNTPSSSPLCPLLSPSLHPPGTHPALTPHSPRTHPAPTPPAPTPHPPLPHPFSRPPCPPLTTRPSFPPLPPTSDGRSRQFGFVGLRSEEEAAAAIAYFNRSFMDTFRLTCEFAMPIGHTALPRAWSKHTQAKETKGDGGTGGKGAAAEGGGKQGGVEAAADGGKGGERGESERGKKKTGKVVGGVAVKQAAQEDEGFREFLEVMERGGKKKVWANDTADGDGGGGGGVGKGRGGGAYGGAYSPHMRIPTVLLSYRQRREDDLRTLLAPYGSLAEVHLVVDHHTKLSKGFAYALFTVPEDAVRPLSLSSSRAVCCTACRAMKALDSSIFQGRLLHVLPCYEGPRLLHLPGPSAARAAGSQASTQEGRVAEAVAQRYGVGKRDPLDPSASDTAVRLALGEAHIVAEAVAQRYGVAKRDLLDPSASDTAVRLALGEAHIVADTKRALLDAGIDVALMEQFATAATAAAAAKAAGKKDTKEDGSATGGGGSLVRSRSVVLVKNLPFKVEAGELVGLFQRFGPVARFVLPPTNTVALVEMADSADAKRAFKGLAYKRYQHVPLYLEWAPEGIFLEPAAPSDTPTTTAAAAAAASSREGEGGAGVGKEGGGEKKAKKQGAVGLLPVVMDGKAARRMAAEADMVGGTGGREGGGEGAEGHAVEGEEDGQPTSHSVFVKNLSFATTETQLKEHLEKLLRSKHAGADGEGPALRSVTIKKRVRNGKQLSMGFGFAEFGSVLAAHRACKLLQVSCHVHPSSYPVGGPCVVPHMASCMHGLTALRAAHRTCKLLHPFEATKRDIQQLFAPFGQLKSMRLPRKFDGGHRGFAFVEFATKREAESAFDALKSTHLYGRHLVLERAKEGEGLDELRAKTAAQFLDGGAGGVRQKKRAKLGQGVDDSDVAFREMQFG
ncbi:unnamed protein product [Closterium sp. NIES-64]|nr:unnamed protein product [Closterium sp. NIES-64]